jgi:hypothetical protein
MPWEITAIEFDGLPPRSLSDVNDGPRRPLGSIEYVQQRIQSACPTVKWQTEPSYAEIGLALPKGCSTREVEIYEHARIHGFGSGEDGTAFEFFGFYVGLPVKELHIDVRHVGNPFPLLRRLCLPENWTAYELCTGQPQLDLAQDWTPNYTPADKPVDKIVRRADVAAALKRWQAGEMTTGQMQAWASARYLNPEVEYEDCEPDLERSVTSQVLGTLDCLGINLVLPEDVPIFLRFLETPIGNFEAGNAAFEKALVDRDESTRQEQLREIWPYDPLAKRP